MTHAPRRCSRCGADVLPLADLAHAAQAARLALDGMRLAVPDALTRNVRAVAAALACYSQSCTPPAPRDAA